MTTWFLILQLVTADGMPGQTELYDMGPNEGDCRSILEEVLPTRPKGTKAQCLPSGEGAEA